MQTKKTLKNRDFPDGRVGIFRFFIDFLYLIRITYVYRKPTGVRSADTSR